MGPLLAWFLCLLQGSTSISCSKKISTNVIEQPPSAIKARELHDQFRIHPSEQQQQWKQQQGDNPFVYEEAWRNSYLIFFYELFKYLVTGPVLFTIRFVLCMLILCFAWMIAKIGIGVPSLAPFCRSIMAYISRTMMFVVGFYWVGVKGEPCAPKEARIVVIAPHQTVCTLE